MAPRPQLTGECPSSCFGATAENLERVDIRFLGTAWEPADSAACNLSDHALVDALCRLAQAAVRVRVYQLRETRLAALPSHPLYRLAQAPNVEVRARQAGLVHLKSSLADSQVLRTGSANFSAPASSARTTTWS